MAQLPSTLAPAHRAVITIVDEGQAQKRTELISKLFLLLGSYCYYQACCPASPLYNLRNEIAVAPVAEVASNTEAPAASTASTPTRQDAGRASPLFDLCAYCGG